MEWIEKLLISIAGIITAIGGVAGIRFLATRKSEKRKAEAEAEDSTLGTLRKQYDWLQQKYDALNKRIDGLYDELHALEKKNLELIRRNNELELQLKDAAHNICVRPDDDCLRRLPPRVYCRLKKLAKGDYDSDYVATDDDNNDDNNKDNNESNDGNN